MFGEQSKLIILFYSHLAAPDSTMSLWVGINCGTNIDAKGVYTKLHSSLMELGSFTKFDVKRMKDFNIICSELEKKQKKTQGIDSSISIVAWGLSSTEIVARARARNDRIDLTKSMKQISLVTEEIPMLNPYPSKKPEGNNSEVILEDITADIPIWVRSKKTLFHLFSIINRGRYDSQPPYIYDRHYLGYILSNLLHWLACKFVFPLEIGDSKLIILGNSPDLTLFIYLLTKVFRVYFLPKDLLKLEGAAGEHDLWILQVDSNSYSAPDWQTSYFAKRIHTILNGQRFLARWWDRGSYLRASIVPVIILGNSIPSAFLDPYFFRNIHVMQWKVCPIVSTLKVYQLAFTIFSNVLEIRDQVENDNDMIDLDTKYKAEICKWRTFRHLINF
jgi:hypothetical protein